MGKTTEIAWCDSTFNPWIGCQKVSAGCDNCYAEALMDKRWGKVEWGPHGERKRTSDDYWKQPLAWAKAARRKQEAWALTTPNRPQRPRVFCASLADVFDNQAPAEWRADLFALIAATPELDWLLLTKRPENIAKLMPGRWALTLDVWPSNIWLGTTCEDQAAFDRRWPILAEIPAAVRFVSYEPAIGPLRLFGKDGPVDGLSWLICGGESGQGYRWMQPEWERDVRLDCERLGVAYFFKQMAGKKPIPPEMLVRQFPRATMSAS